MADQTSAAVAKAIEAAPMSDAEIVDALRRELERMSEGLGSAQTEFEVLLQVVLLALFLERGLALVFESNLVVPFFARHRGWKSLIAFFTALGACSWYGLDALGTIFSLDGETSWLGYLLTAAVVGGGSKVSIKLFRDYFDIRSRVSREYEAERSRKIEAARQNVTEILEIQDHLARYGFLERTGNSRGIATSPEVVAGELDSATQAGIKLLQKRYGLNADGFPTPDLVEILQTARCAHGDSGRALSTHRPWPDGERRVLWAVGETPKVVHPHYEKYDGDERARTAAERAFATWAHALPTWTFEKVEKNAANLVLDWVATDPHGLLDGAAVAHATFYDEGRPLCVHLRLGENWADSREGEPDCVDVESVVLHEIGHCLGHYGHLAGGGYVMSERLNRGSDSVNRVLKPEDQVAIARVYRV